MQLPCERTFQKQSASPVRGSFRFQLVKRLRQQILRAKIKTQGKLLKELQRTQEKSMYASKPSVSAVLALLCLTVFCAQCCPAQEWSKIPTTWWPDPSTGLMWAGQIVALRPSAGSGVPIWGGANWQQANDYCAALQLGGFTGWRLPTLDEVKDSVEIIRVVPAPVCISASIRNGGCRDTDLMTGTKYSALSLRGGINISGPGRTIWTATLSENDPKFAWNVALASIPDGYAKLEVIQASSFQTNSKSAWLAELNSVPPPFKTAKLTQVDSVAECVRPLEANLLRAAKAAEVNHPVSDLRTLQTFIPLNKARLAYQAGNYQESISQAQIAVSLKADPATAYWVIGISHGRLGQWDDAISNLQSALKIDKDYRDAENALKWAKEGSKAAKKGKQPKEPTPKWN